jgi:hypothetical protein
MPADTPARPIPPGPDARPDARPDTRRDRQEAALRANLLRRKEQARRRCAVGADDAPAPPQPDREG